MIKDRLIEDRPQSVLFQQLAGDLVNGGFTFRFQARGRSMNPTVQDGEVLCVQPLEHKTLRVGDIVLTKTAGDFTAHRIIQKRGDLFTTRGDAGCEPDGEVHRGQIFGVVIGKECPQSGRRVRLYGVLARLNFHAREAKRRMTFLADAIIKLSGTSLPSL